MIHISQRIDSWLRSLQIQRKFMLVLVANAGASLFTAGLIIIIADSVLFYDFLKRDLTTFATVIAENSTASLAFDDSRSAGETLAALRARSHLISACLYRVNGTMLAAYLRGGSGPCPLPRGNEIEAGVKDLILTRPVMLEGRRVGAVVLQYDLGQIQERIRLYGVTVLLVILAASAVALMLSSKLSALVATPILQLAQTAAEVAETRDYRIRAQKNSRDEVGLLADTFNTMLAGIETRDRELTKALDAQRRSLELAAKANADLRRSNDDLERFAFIASHDLQEPLRNVTISSQLLVKHLPEKLDERATAWVERIVAGTRRMRDLLTDLRGYIEIAASTQEVLSPVDLNEAVRKALRNLEVAIEESSAVIDVSPLPVIEQAQEAHWVSLLQNLIGNAIKYRGDRPPHIRISVEERPAELCIAVADNGIGIAPAHREKIFTPFKRLHGSEIPGTGIGLAICKRVIERYGGRIWVESEAGQGCTFLLTLPRGSEKKS